MKEATGELNMTVITVVAIAAVAAFFYAFIWPAIQAGLARNTCSNLCPEGIVEDVDTDNKQCICGDERNTVIDYSDFSNGE